MESLFQYFLALLWTALTLIPINEQKLTRVTMKITIFFTHNPDNLFTTNLIHARSLLEKGKTQVFGAELDKNIFFLFLMKGVH